MTGRCLITYERLEGRGPYSPAGLRMLSPRLRGLRDFALSREEQLAEAARLAGKLSIQGVQPKLSARLDVAGGQFVTVERRGTFIVKPQNPLWPELPQNEDLTMRLAEAAGVSAPLHGLLRSRDTSLSYFVRRFDRTGRAARRAVEDFAQLSGKSRETKYDSSMEQVAALLDRFATFPAVEKVKLFALTIVSFMVGNEDLHLKNFSLVTVDGKCLLAPAYDLLNTTITLPEAREEMALPVRGKKRRLTREDLLDYYGRDRLELNTPTIDAVLARIAATRGRWDELVAASFLSPERKSRYADLLRERRGRLGL